MEEKKQPNRMLPVLLIGIALLAVVIVLLVVLLLRKPDAGEPTVSISDDAVPRIGYAEGVNVLDDHDSLQAAVDAMLAETGGEGIMLEYKNDAFSSNGTDFSCYIGNSAFNQYPMYFGIYSDETFTDELFLSQLIRPGYVMEDITLNRALEPGAHRVYLAYTQVEDHEGEFSIHAQTLHTMDFYVQQ